MGLGTVSELFASFPKGTTLNKSFSAFNSNLSFEFVYCVLVAKFGLL